MPKVLTIAGSDSGGGAGIQADLKTVTVLGCYGLSVITALTAQNTLGVQGIHEPPLAFIAQQIDSVLSDIGADASKTGMLANPDVVRLVASKIKAYQVPNLVVDPVMVAQSGDTLVTADTRAALMSDLIPLARVITPNRPEAEVLLDRPIKSAGDLAEAARALHPTRAPGRAGQRRPYRRPGPGPALRRPGGPGILGPANPNAPHPRLGLHLFRRHRRAPGARPGPAGGRGRGQGLYHRGHPRGRPLGARPGDRPTTLARSRGPGGHRTAELKPAGSILGRAPARRPCGPWP